MLVICAHLQTVILVSIRLKKKRSLNFEIKNKALTSIIIKIFENSLQFKPHINHWCSLSDTRIQTNTINGKKPSSVRNTSGRIEQSTYKLPWLSVGYSIIHVHCRNCACQLKPMDVYIFHFLSENICTKTNQARCSACNETTTIWEWAYGISVLTS